jgi:hypothetical protein
MDVAMMELAKAVTLIAGIVATAGFLPDCALAQQNRPSDHPIIPVIGTVKSISGNLIAVESGDHIITVATDNHTEVWKGKLSHDLGLVQIGDDFAGGCREDASGRLVAELIELNVVNFFGVITKVDHGGVAFEMFTNPKADPQSGYEKKKLTVVVDADTVFDASAQEDLKVGRDVQITGVDLRNGSTRATRVVVYEGDRPVRTGNGKVMPVTGPAK